MEPSCPPGPQINLSHLYTQGNYLFDLNQDILRQWFPNNTPDAGVFSKWKWSETIKKEMIRVRRERLLLKTQGQANLVCFELKADPGQDEVLMCLPKGHRCALIRARHGLIDYSDCKCGTQHVHSL